MNAEEKKANKVTRREVVMILGMVLTMILIFTAGMASRSWAGDVIVHLGSQDGVARAHQGGVQVVRGFSNYPVYETRESSKPETDKARQFFGEWDNWRHRIARCKVSPNGRGRRSC